MAMRRSGSEQWARLNGTEPDSVEHKLSLLMGTKGATFAIAELNRRGVERGLRRLNTDDFAYWCEAVKVPDERVEDVLDAYEAEHGVFDTDEKADKSAEAERLRQQGMSMVEIGHELGITPQAVSKRLGKKKAE